MVIERGKPFKGMSIPLGERNSVIKQMDRLVNGLHRDCSIVHGNITEKSFVWAAGVQTLKLVNFSSARHVEDKKGPWVFLADRWHFSPNRIEAIKSSILEVVPPPTKEDDLYALALLQLSMCIATQRIKSTALPKLLPTRGALQMVEDTDLRKKLMDIEGDDGQAAWVLDGRGPRRVD